MNSLIKNTTDGYFYKKWTMEEAFAYFVKGVARELKISPNYWERIYYKIVFRNFKKKWLVNDDKSTYFEFTGGAKLPDISQNKNMFEFLCTYLFEEVFLFPVYFEDKYEKSIVESMDHHLNDGPYGYSNGKFDVTIQQGDVVIDAGAWIGDFSAYVAAKGATVYAFEPTEKCFTLLCETAKLNNNRIIPIQKGLSNVEKEAFLSTEESGVGNFICAEQDATSETINLTTIDKFVERNKLERVDFIKSDIEGTERDLLRGATNVLKTFAPKLAICTYHLPDDPKLLEKIIKDANPDYSVVHIQRKLFAAVVK
jgi:FkbM family methyltransferase